tara:strand:- start:5093 stop:6340 length:1248 start_codon:yes stop_codon:yes gene_type:complete
VKEYNIQKFCRLCNSKLLINFIDFGKVPIGNNLLKKYDSSLKAKKYPLKVKRCTSCGHFQLSHIINKKILYTKNYTYLSGVAKDFIKHFEKYSNFIKKNYLKNMKNKKILDIGSNDGTCLKFFKNLGAIVVGIDPAKKASIIANKQGITTFNNFFNNETHKIIKKKYSTFDLITSHNVLAHVENNQFIFQKIYELLKPNGIFVFEVGYFIDVLKNNYFDTIYHEHLDYHHCSPLLLFLKNIGFSVIEISRNNAQGGSIRVISKKLKQQKTGRSVLKFLKNEKIYLKNKENYILNWQNNNLKKINNFQKLVEYEMKFNKKIIGYGSPTKIVLLLKLSNLDSRNIKFIHEDNHLKLNKFLPTTGIPIKKININNLKNIDVIIIFAWNFSKNIINNIKKYKKNIKIIIPLPKPKIIKI